MALISTYLITFNEEDKIENAIRSVQWSDEVLVIDSFSTDKTVSIAQSLGAKVVQVEFKGFGDLRNQALSHCQHDWVFSLDSDEICTPEVAQEIRQKIDNPSHDVFYVPRRNFFLGHEVKHSGWYPNYRQPQLFHKHCFKYDNLPVHEGFELIGNAKVGHLQQAIWQFPFKNLAESIVKMNRYSTLGAVKKRQQNSSFAKALGHAIWAFLKHYVFKLGILDGWQGFFIAFSYFEVTLYRYAKAVELNEGEAWSKEWKKKIASSIAQKKV
jgi:glycosyltransferase involved in cell wall biosynthesis